MKYTIVRDPYSGSYFIEGKGHSWGSFKTKDEANQFLEQIEDANKAWETKQVARREQTHSIITEQDADRAAQQETDRLLYEGRTA